MELNFKHEEDGDENIIVRTNHVSSLQLVSGIINLAKNEWISKHTAHPYPAKYTDEHETRPIFEVDSHQTDAKGKKRNEVHRLDSLQVFCGSKSNSGQLLLLGLMHIRK